MENCHVLGSTHGCSSYNNNLLSEESESTNFTCDDVRKGPWTIEEDSILTEYVTVHGEGHWNTIARSSGLRRTGKSCRLRWLNYLRPNVRRGNITLQEQLMILELHSRWGNRWSKIAQYLPGRTDNEIKNYWRTRVQKLAKQLKCDVNSKQFRDAMRHVWIPRLMERIHVAKSESSASKLATTRNSYLVHYYEQATYASDLGNGWVDSSNYNLGDSPDSFETQVSSSRSDMTDCLSGSCESMQNGSVQYPETGIGYWSHEVDHEESLESLWNDENIWFLQQQLM